MALGNNFSIGAFPAWQDKDKPFESVLPGNHPEETKQTIKYILVLLLGICAVIFKVIAELENNGWT